MEVVRWFAIFILISFTAYTVYCNLKQSFLEFFKELWSSHFGRQVTFDLYIGLGLFMFFVFLIEGSLTVTLLWLLPAIPFVNIVTLLYFVINFDKIISNLN